MRKYTLLIIIAFFCASSINTVLAQKLKSDSLFAIGLKNYSNSKYAEGLPFFKMAFTVDSAYYETNHKQRLIYIGMWIGNSLYKLGKEEEAKAGVYSSLYYKAQPIDYRKMNEIDALANKGFLLMREKRTNEAIEIFKERGKRLQTIIGSEHIWSANNSSILAELCDSLIRLMCPLTQHNSTTMYKLLHEKEVYTDNYIYGLKYYYGEDSYEFIEMVFEKILNLDAGYYNRSYKIKYANLILDLCKKYHPENILLMVRISNRLAELLYYDADSFEYMIVHGNSKELPIDDETKRIYKQLLESISIYKKNKEFTEQARKTKSIEYIQCLHGLSNALSKLAINMPWNLGQNNNGILQLNFNFYNLNAAKNEKDSISLEKINFLGVAELVDKTLVSNNDSIIAQRKNIYRICLKLNQKSLQIADSIYGKEHYIYYECLSNVLQSYENLDIHNLEKVEILKELSRIELLFDSNYSYDYRIAICYYEMNDYKKAITHFEKYINQGNGDNFTDIIFDYLADSYNKMAINENRNDYIEKSAYYLEKELDYALNSKKSFSNFSIPNIFNRICECYSRTDNQRKLSQYVNMGLNYNIDNILNLFLYADNRTKENLWHTVSLYFDKYLMFAYKNQNEDTFCSITYNTTLFQKNLLLNSDILLKQMIESSTSNPAISELYKSWNTYKQEYNLSLKEDLLIKADSIERILIDKCRIFDEYNKCLKTRWKSIQEYLSPNDIAIEFTSFPIDNDSIMYTALVLRKEMDNPKMITLFEGKQLHAISPKEYYTSPKISQLVWKPLEEELRGVKQIYFAPAGELHNIAIESLMDSDSTFISDRFNLYRLSSTRQLALNKDLNQVKDAKIYGGLEYDTDAKILIAQSREYKPTIRDFGYTSDINPDSLNLRSGAQDLPATKIEAEEIKQSFEKTHKVQAELFTGIKGTETSFKALSGKHPSFIHIATHGFYWNETEAKRQKNMLDIMMLNDNMKNRYVEDKALTRSGLLFSGANIKLRGDAKLPDGVDDGILTAKEIAGLDLRGTELVVLSACQTGLGEITGDGVFGLQRGFKKAGARTLLMSLWKVDDNATKLLMSQFYKNLIAGKSYFESLHNAQKYVRNYEIEIEVKPDDGQPKVILSAQNRTKLQKQNTTQNKVYKKKKIYTDPYYWAAFILLDATD